MGEGRCRRFTRSISICNLLSEISSPRALSVHPPYAVHCPYMARSQRIEIRVTPEEKGLLRVLAERHHTDVAGWIRQRIFSDESAVPGEVVPYRPALPSEPIVVESSPSEPTTLSEVSIPFTASGVDGSIKLRACPDHPDAGTTKVRDRTYCAEPGCPRVL